MTRPRQKRQSRICIVKIRGMPRVAPSTILEEAPLGVVCVCVCLLCWVRVQSAVNLSVVKPSVVNPNREQGVSNCQFRFVSRPKEQFPEETSRCALRMCRILLFPDLLLDLFALLFRELLPLLPCGRRVHSRRKPTRCLHRGRTERSAGGTERRAGSSLRYGCDDFWHGRHGAAGVSIASSNPR